MPRLSIVFIAAAVLLCFTPLVDAQPRPDLLNDVCVVTAACAWALVGEEDRALTNLEKAYATGFGPDRGSTLADPDLATLREDPRFRKLIETP